MPAIRKTVQTGNKQAHIFIKPRWANANSPHRLRRKIGELFPALKITIGNSEIIGVQMKVNGAHEGGSIIGGEHQGKQFFTKGERVLEIHVNTIQPTDAVRLIDLLIAHLPEIKKMGFIGLYGYTPTHTIAKAFIKKTKGQVQEAQEVEVTPVEQSNAKKYYKERIPKYSFPEKHLQNEVTGVALRF